MAPDREKEGIENFEKIVTEFQDPLFRYAFWRTGSAAEAEDIVQDVLLKFYHRGFKTGSITNVKSYLFRSVANASADLKNCRREISLDSLPRDTATELETDGSYMEDYRTVTLLMEEIPEEQAEVIRLWTMAGLSFIEIAEISGVPVTTVKSRFTYGIQKLRASFKEKGMKL